MPKDTRTEIMQMVEADQVALLRQENALVKEIAAAYERTRQSLITALLDRASVLGDNPTPAQIQALASDVSLIEAINGRLTALQSDLQTIVSGGLTDVSQKAFEAMANEVNVLAKALGEPVFQFMVDPNLELTIGPAVGQIPGLIAGQKAVLTGSLREGLAAGDRFSQIVKQVFGADQSAFANGLTSAELMVRRAVMQANNNSRLLALAEAQKKIKRLQKQAIAFVGGDTTRTCLEVNGQIKDIDKPFVIEGKPSFGRLQMQPPFHWRCRTTVVMYHPVFEEGSS